MSETAEKLLGLGTPLELIDGRKVSILFTLRTYAQIEAKFGSLAAVDQIMAEGRRGPLVTHLGEFLEHSIVGGTFSADEILGLIGAEHLGLVTDLVYDVLLAGFQLPQRITSPETAATTPVPTPASPGGDTSTSGASSLVNAEPTSGT